MTSRTEQFGLQIDNQLYNFINQEVLPHTALNAENFWQGVSKIVATLTPTNRELLAKRDELQQQIDLFHQQNKTFDYAQYQQFLTDIGYLVAAPQHVEIETTHVDQEIAKTAGAQLVVPVSNARFALNAANARWGSLYDALYGSDVIAITEQTQPTGQYNAVRGQKVIDYGRAFLDNSLPLSSGSHAQSTQYALVNGELVVTLDDSTQVGLVNPQQLVGFQGNETSPTGLIFQHHNLHFIIQIDPQHPIGKTDKAKVKDIVLESALTTIMDCEDSVAAVDAEDKVNVYRNWFGLMTGTLNAEFKKAGKTLTRTLAKDVQYTRLNGEAASLSGRSLMFVRNVGHLMTNPAIVDSQGNEVFEGIMDAIFTSLCALPEFYNQTEFVNSKTNSIYIVKPKIHGAEEVAFSDTLFAAVEELLALPRYTIKMGIMDEERRTSANLKACIYAAKHRVVFINTGFLDRTGDEIHTSMEAGTVLPKGEIKNQPWIDAYEKRNVSIGLNCGLSGKAQIGKGMWPMPDKLALMMEQKTAHLLAGANTAWVPSPTAATLHAMHYHQIDVFAEQKKLATNSEASLQALLTPPLGEPSQLTGTQIQTELDNNAQGILGYVVRWVDQGVGCSKVPDINHVGLMEDRATLRISSQHIANWLRHGVCSEAQVVETMRRMAKVVDEQNAGDENYINMAENEQSFANSLAFNAALDLVLKGTSQPNGYTEPLLHKYRRAFKSKQSETRTK